MTLENMPLACSSESKTIGIVRLELNTAALSESSTWVPPACMNCQKSIPYTTQRLMIFAMCRGKRSVTS